MISESIGFFVTEAASAFLFTGYVSNVKFVDFTRNIVVKIGSGSSFSAIF